MGLPGVPIRNPFAGLDEYNCFACDPNNATGLHLEFRRVDRGVAAVWQPRDDLQGYPGVVHGGIQSTLVDEVAAWYVYVALETVGITRSLHITYIKPALIADGPFTVTAIGRTPTRKSVEIDATLVNERGELCAEAVVEYAIFSQEIARRRFHFPGSEAFKHAE